MFWPLLLNTALWGEVDILLKSSCMTVELLCFFFDWLISYGHSQITCVLGLSAMIRGSDAGSWLSGRSHRFPLDGPTVWSHACPDFWSDHLPWTGVRQQQPLSVRAGGASPADTSGRFNPAFRRDLPRCSDLRVVDPNTGLVTEQRASPQPQPAALAADAADGERDGPPPRHRPVLSTVPSSRTCVICSLLWSSFKFLNGLHVVLLRRRMCG